MANTSRIVAVGSPPVASSHASSTTRLPSFDLAAPEIEQPGPDQDARKQRALTERARHRDRALGQRDAVVPIADAGSVLDLDFRRPDAEQRRVELVGNAVRLGDVTTHIVRLAGETGQRRERPVRRPGDAPLTWRVRRARSPGCRSRSRRSAGPDPQVEQQQRSVHASQQRVVAQLRSDRERALDLCARLR